LVSISACSPERVGGDAPAGSGSAAVWARDAGASPPIASDGGLAVADDASAAALDELLAAAAGARAPGATGKGGGSRIGTPTGNAATDAGSPASSAAPPKAQVAVGAPTTEALVASPALEREARAQLYWPLVNKCKGDDGRILPPDAVTLTFTIDGEGYIQPSSIAATTDDPRHDRAAQCMIRELGASSFRMPPSSRGVPTRVTATVPSID